MKIKYKATFWVDNDSKAMIKELKELGMVFKKDEYKVIEFNDDDTDSELLKKIFKQYNIDLERRSIFSDKDKLDSQYLRLQATWHFGYPQPEDNYLVYSYDLSNYCNECGIGKKQIKSLRFSKEPKWGQRHFLQLNWIFDEYFVPPLVYSNIFKSLNVNSKEVINHKKNIPFENVCQLEIPTVESNLIIDNCDFEICKKCSRKKYKPILVGSYPALKNHTNLNIFKTREFFGSGARAFNLVYINNHFYKELVSKNVNGLNFIPTGSGVNMQTK